MSGPQSTLAVITTACIMKWFCRWDTSTLLLPTSCNQRPQSINISCYYFHQYCQYLLLCCKIIFIKASTMIDNSNTFSSHIAVSVWTFNPPTHTTPHQFNKILFWKSQTRQTPTNLHVISKSRERLLDLFDLHPDRILSLPGIFPNLLILRD